MPAFLEKRLESEYPNDPHAVYGTMNAIGAMKGNRETPKGAAMQAKHDKKAAVTSKLHAMLMAGGQK